MSKKPPEKQATEAQIFEQPISNTLTENYMPYAMSVIVSRAIPEIDGFKPAHRKLLYTMYKMGLLGQTRTKSANVVGATMKLNPHGEMAIYDTLVRLSKGYEALLHPFVDSKGNFGKVYSRDMAYAASRYTEVKLDPICAELFKDIDMDSVDFVDNYDNTMKEPALLPVTFPNILVNPNLGIAVGMASNICSFNLGEICDAAIAYLKDPSCDLLETLKAPDFSTGGQLIFSHKEMQEIYETGRGSFKLRAKYSYDAKQNCIDIYEIPYTTTVEAIIDKMGELIKSGKIREINDVRDETDLNGLKITIDLKRGVDPDKLMQKLYKMTPLEDVFACNFNVLISGTPKVMGVREILDEWSAFRIECVRRKLFFEMQRKKEKLHLLKGLAKILLDIDKAVRIIRETDEESEVVPNLMIGFGIDSEQAEFVAEIKLRHLNREYILNRTSEIEQLEKDIQNLNDTLQSRAKVVKIIIDELAQVRRKYARERKTEIIFEDEVETYSEELHIEDYPVVLFLTSGSYFKKITPQSLRMSAEHKLKEGDYIVKSCDASNKDELLLFTSKAQVYKTRLYEFEDMKASILGDYLPAKLNMEPDEQVLGMAVTNDYSGVLLLFFADGRAVKLGLDAYYTKQSRKKLVSAFYDKAPLAALFQMEQGQDFDFLLRSSAGKYLLVNSAAIPKKSTRTSQGIKVMTLKANQTLDKVEQYRENLVNPKYYRAKTLPAAGIFLREEDKGEQLTLQ